MELALAVAANQNRHTNGKTINKGGGLRRAVVVPLSSEQFQPSNGVVNGKGSKFAMG